MKKKGQGISLETIIIAVIALVVLIVLYFIFTGKLNLWGGDVDKSTRGGKCIDSSGPLPVASGGSSVKGKWYPTCPSNMYNYGFIYSDSNDNPGQECCFTRAASGADVKSAGMCTYCARGRCNARVTICE